MRTIAIQGTVLDYPFPNFVLPDRIAKFIVTINCLCKLTAILTLSLDNVTSL